MQYDNYSLLRKGKTKLGMNKAFMGLVALTLPAVILSTSAAASATATVVVTPTFEHGWSATTPLADTKTGGAVNFVTDTMAPAGNGALQLTTDSSITAKAQYMHVAGIPLIEVTELSFYTKQNFASFVGGNASYQLSMYLNGTSGFTTLVYEPYQGGGGSVVPGLWQRWDVYPGKFWSTREVTCSNGTLSKGNGGPAIHTLAEIKAKCPEAVVLAYGLNIGSNNLSYNVEADLFNFNGTTFDFERNNEPSSKSDCKSNGWTNLTDQNDQPFKNQGQCVSWTNG
jgi:hypothetical protein